MYFNIVDIINDTFGTKVLVYLTKNEVGVIFETEEINVTRNEVEKLIVNYLIEKKAKNARKN